MESSPSLLSRLYNWLIGEPTVRQINQQVLKIPTDSSPPHLVLLNTIDITAEGNVDACQGHIPGFRPYWGTKEGFHWRDIVQFEVRDQSLPELNGVYFGWNSFALDHIPLSEHTGFCGDAFIAKSPLWEYDENGAVYEDFPAGSVETPLLGMMLERMHDR